MAGFNREAAKAAGYSDSEIDAFLGSPPQPTAPAYDPSEGATLNVAGFDTGIGLHPSIARGLAGAGKAFMDAGRGLGIVDSADEGTKAIENKLMETTAGKVGNIGAELAMLAPTAFIPGANTMKGAALINGISTAALKEGDWKSRLKEGALSGALGAGTVGAVKAASRVVSPEVAPDVRQLLDEGVRLTPGQILGGGAKRAEEAMESIPVIGDAIKKGQSRGIEDFNRNVLDRVLAPVGGKAKSTGYVGVEDVRKQLNSNYESMLPHMKVDVLEPEFVNNMANVRSMAKNLPPEAQKYFDDVLSREIDGRLAPNGMLSGDNLQAVKSALRNEYEAFGKSNDGYQRKLGEAFHESEKQLRELISRQNPQYADKLQANDAAWAMFKRVQNAAGQNGAVDGVFSPVHLRSAARALDKSKDKARFAEGNALMQDVADMGKDVLSPNIPNSGAPLRAALMTLAGAGIVNPKLPVMMLGGAAAYTGTGQKVLQKVLAERPEIANKLAAIMRDNANVPSTVANALYNQGGK